MSKRAKQAALKAYPPHKGASQEWIKLHLSGGDCACFIKGYEQAEKDLALTWEDIAKIITIYEAGIENGDYDRYNDAKWMKEYSNDILRKFNQIKELK